MSFDKGKLEELIGRLKVNIAPSHADCLEAAALLRSAEAEMGKLREALEAIADNYANQDVSHQNFRVHAYEVASAALSGGRDAS